jgi:transposase
MTLMGAVVELSDPEWKWIEHLFDPAGRRGAPARYPRRRMVDAMLCLARTGSPWRYLPDHNPPWPAVWRQWRRWRSSGAWATAMLMIADGIRSKKRSHVQSRW